MVFCSNTQIFKLQLGNLLFIMHSVCRNHDFVLSCLFHLKRLSTWSWRMPGYYGPGSCQSTVLSFGADDKVSGDIFSNVKRGKFWNKIPTMNILGPLHLGVSPIWLWEAVCVCGGAGWGDKEGAWLFWWARFGVFSFGSGKVDTGVIPCSNLPSNSGGGIHWRKHDAQVKAARFWSIGHSSTNLDKDLVKH